MQPDFLLASASPRRQELLRQLGCRFAVLPVDIDESARPGEEARELVLRLAAGKARAGERLNASSCALPVLGADTAVVTVDGTVLGKPRTQAEGLHMLGMLSGRMHVVLTGVALAVAGRLHTACSETRVFFRDLGQEEALRYWATGEPRDKAGGYAIQGFGAVFVERIEGSYSGVVGLPLFETASLLHDAGMECWQRMVPRDE